MNLDDMILISVDDHIVEPPTMFDVGAGGSCGKWITRIPTQRGPNAPQQLWDNIGYLPEKDINGISHENPITAFSFDPFTHRSEAAATVGAMRTEAEGVDVTVKSTGRRQADADGGSLSATLASLGSKGADEAN